MWIDEARAWLARLDASLFQAINIGIAWEPLDQVMRLATAVGTGLFQGAASVVLTLLGSITGRAGIRRAGFIGMIAVAVSGVAAQVGKFLWDRPRPVLALYDVRIVGDPLFVHSFPSGHTMTVFAAMTAWAVAAPRLRWSLLVIASVTAFSRIYVGAHFPLDVIFGALFGMFIGRLSARVLCYK